MVVKSAIALLMLGLSAPLIAATADSENAPTPAPTESASEATTPAAQPAARPAAERRICRRLESTGSRTGGQRVCMTAAEWRRADN